MCPVIGGIRHSSIITHKTGANARQKGKEHENILLCNIIIDDRGRATANVTDMIKAEEKPESTYTSTRRKDIYNDWLEKRKKKHKSMWNKQELHKTRAEQ